jgi:hypothetical protein
VSSAHLAADPDRLLGEPAEELGGVDDLALGLGQQLAVLGHHGVGQLVDFGVHQVERPAQDLRALAGRGSGPRFPGRGRDVDRGDALVGGRGGDLGQDLVPAWIFDRHRGPVPRHPLTVDVVLGPKFHS